MHAPEGEAEREHSQVDPPLASAALAGANALRDLHSCVGANCGDDDGENYEGRAVKPGLANASPLAENGWAVNLIRRAEKSVLLLALGG